MNASYGGAAQWVARVDRSHKVLCGYPPTFGAKPAIEVAEDVAPVAPAKVAPVVVAAAPVVVKPAKANAPMATVASAMMPEAEVVKPVPQVRVEHSTTGLVASLPTPAQSYERVAAEPAPGRIGCYTSAPVAEVVRLRNGGTAVVCTRGDGTLTGWRPPIYPRGAGVGAALSEPVQVARADNAGVGRVAAAPAYASAAVPDVVVPKGYKLAWTDDRLNPQRGVGTAEGQAAQDQLWTQKVPAKLISDVQKAKTRKHKPLASVTVSSSGQAEVAPKPVRGGGLGADWHLWRACQCGGGCGAVAGFGPAGGEVEAASRRQGFADRDGGAVWLGGGCASGVADGARGWVWRRLYPLRLWCDLESPSVCAGGAFAISRLDWA